MSAEKENPESPAVSPAPAEDSLATRLPSPDDPSHHQLPPDAPVLPSTGSARSLEPGAEFHGFEITGVLGRGAFGTVYLARQLSLDRLVALKIAAADGAEGRTMAQLEHPSIVQVFSETVLPNGRERMLCMQYVAGPTLQTLLHRLTDTSDKGQWTGAELLEHIDAQSSGATTFDPVALRHREMLQDCDFISAVCTIGHDLAEALEYAHRNGVLHRDIKPANILVSQYGRPMLVDFNLAFRSAGSDTAVFGGTLAYMAPEHLRAFNPADSTGPAAVDERSDLYSLGMLLYQLRTGEVAFLASAESDGNTDLFQRFADSREADPPFPARLNRADEALQTTIRRCLAGDPADRFASAGELAKVLDGCRSLAQVESRLPPAGPLARPAARRPVLWLGLSILVPHIIASVLNVAYNAIRLETALTPHQKTVFGWLVLGYNLIAWPVCLGWAVRMLAPFRAMNEASAVDDAALREQLIKLPRLVVLVACLGWFPGVLYFPLMLDWLDGPIGTDVYGHFALNLTISGLVAVAYSALATQFVSLRVLYPRLWRDPRSIENTASEELASIPRRVTILQFLAGMIPLTGALLIVLIGPDKLGGGTYRWFRVLVCGLIIAGLCGFQIATLTCARIARTVNCFIGNKR